jgi:hypothetical protein
MLIQPKFKVRALAFVLRARLASLKQTSSCRIIQWTRIPSCFKARSLYYLDEQQTSPFLSAKCLRTLHFQPATCYSQASNHYTNMADDPSDIEVKSDPTEIRSEDPDASHSSEKATAVDDQPEAEGRVNDKKRQQNKDCHGKGQSKKSKSDKKNNTRRQDGEGGYAPGRGSSRMTVHPGSYASEGMRELFKVSLPPHLLPPENPPTGEDYEEEKEKRAYTKKKVAFLLGYLGTGYSGFQTNEGRRTLQAEFELAMVRSELISPLNFGYFHKYSWSTSGRTDKGKHNNWWAV